MKRVDKRSRPPAARQSSPGPRESVRFVGNVVVLAIIALTLRLVYIWQIRESPFFDVLMGDARRYDAWAMEIASGDWIGQDVFYQAPLYPYFLGFIYAIAGHSLFLVRVSQAVIGTAACVLLALAARRLYSERAGLIAGLGLALYAPAIFSDGLLQKSVLDVFLVCLVLWLVSGLVDEPAKRPRWLWLGMSLGFLALTRENALAIVGAILLLPPGLSRSAHRQRLLYAGVLVLGLVIVLLPVAARNRIVGGEWHLTTSQFGPNLYIGNNPHADGTYGAMREGRGSPEYERQDATEIAEAAAGRRLTPREVSSFWVRQTMEYVRSQPGAWLALMGWKAALLWNRTEFVDTESQASYEDWSSLLRALAPFGHFGILVPLAVLGIIATWPDRSRTGVYYAIAIAYAASVVLFYVSARYRMPLVPLLVLFAAGGWASLATFLRTAGAPKTAAAAATIGAVIIVTNVPLLSEDLMRATTETNLGVALQTDGRLHEAETHYRRALATQPDYAPAHVNLGMVLVALNRPDEAIEAYKRAIELESGDVDLDVRLGNAYFRLGSLLVEREQFREAVDVFRAGLVLVPDSPQGHNNLGGALAASGRTAEAIAEFEQALRLDPNLLSARRNLELLRSQK